MYDVVSNGPQPIKRWLHHNLLRPCNLGGDCFAKLVGNRMDNDFMEVPPVLEVSFKWCLPPIEPGSSAPVDPEEEGETTSVSLMVNP